MLSSLVLCEWNLDRAEVRRIVKCFSSRFNRLMAGHRFCSLPSLGWYDRLAGQDYGNLPTRVSDRLYSR
jgi:hypothetical protein